MNLIKKILVLLPLIILISCGGSFATDGSPKKINRASATEIDKKTGKHIPKGEFIDGQVHKNSLIMRYSRALDKVECSDNLSDIKTIGIVDDNVARIPSYCKFMKIYFTKDNNPTSKIFSITASTYVDIKEIINKDSDNTNGVKLKTIPAYEVSKEVGVPIRGGEAVDVKIYSSYFIIKYTKTLIKVKYSNNLTNINIAGIADEDIAIIPIDSSFVKLYFIQDDELVSKTFDITIPINK